jgi:hypothetical protein
MKKLNVDEIESFGKWWDVHGPVYLAQGITKEQAYSIWYSAISSVENAFKTLLIKKWTR